MREGIEVRVGRGEGGEEREGRKWKEQDTEKKWEVDGEVAEETQRRREREMMGEDVKCRGDGG